MFELFVLFVFGWMLVKSIGFALRLTWGAAKIVGGILMVLALPLMIVCMVFFGGIALLLPIAVIALAAGIFRACI